MFSKLLIFLECFVDRRFYFVNSVILSISNFILVLTLRYSSLLLYDDSVVRSIESINREFNIMSFYLILSWSITVIYSIIYKLKIIRLEKVMIRQHLLVIKSLKVLLLNSLLTSTITIVNILVYFFECNYPSYTYLDYRYFILTIIIILFAILILLIRSIFDKSIEVRLLLKVALFFILLLLFTEILYYCFFSLNCLYWDVGDMLFMLDFSVILFNVFFFRFSIYVNKYNSSNYKNFSDGEFLSNCSFFSDINTSVDFYNNKSGYLLNSKLMSSLTNAGYHEIVYIIIPSVFIITVSYLFTLIIRLIVNSTLVSVVHTIYWKYLYVNNNLKYKRIVYIVFMSYVYAKTISKLFRLVVFISIRVRRSLIYRFAYKLYKVFNKFMGRKLIWVFH